MKWGKLKFLIVDLGRSGLSPIQRVLSLLRKVLTYYLCSGVDKVCLRPPEKEGSPQYKVGVWQGRPKIYREKDAESPSFSP